MLNSLKIHFIHFSKWQIWKCEEILDSEHNYLCDAEKMNFNVNLSVCQYLLSNINQWLLSDSLYFIRFLKVKYKHDWLILHKFTSTTHWHVSSNSSSILSFYFWGQNENTNYNFIVMSPRFFVYICRWRWSDSNESCSMFTAPILL